MLQVTVIGNLGADAREETYNGNKFLSFNVAHTESWRSQDGQRHESTTWVSCALNGDGGNLRQYLVKGKTVMVQGRLSTRVYSSPKERNMVAGINCSVDKIELLGGRVDDVPRQLVTKDGLLYNVSKIFYVEKDAILASGASKKKDGELFSNSGAKFSVTAAGVVTKLTEQSLQDNTKNTDNAQQQNVDRTEEDELPF